jgi:hypothetical protein
LHRRPVDAPLGTEVDAEHRDAATRGRLRASLGHHVESIPCPFEAQVIATSCATAFIGHLRARGKILTHSDERRFEP